LDNTGPYLGQFNTCNNDNNTARSALFYYATSAFSGVGGRKSIALPPMATMHKGIGSTLLSYMIRVGQANAVAVQKTNFEESRCSMNCGFDFLV
jgi:hypothetical protein